MLTSIIGYECEFFIIFERIELKVPQLKRLSTVTYDGRLSIDVGTFSVIQLLQFLLFFEIK
jgi:hypothetical protein